MRFMSFMSFRTLNGSLYRLSFAWLHGCESHVYYTSPKVCREAVIFVEFLGRGIIKLSDG